MKYSGGMTTRQMRSVQGSSMSAKEAACTSGAYMRLAFSR